MDGPGGSVSLDAACSTLRAMGELGQDEERQFEAALRGLTAGSGSDPVIDLSGATYVSSSYVRFIATAMVEASKGGHTLVVRARKRVARLLSMGGLDKLGRVEVVGD